MRNTVWRNYSDNHVYPSMYKFFGYEPLNNSEIKGKWLKSVCEEPNVNGLIGKRGIIIVSEHAIGFRCPDGVMKLCDNDSGEYGVSGINSSIEIKMSLKSTSNRYKEPKINVGIAAVLLMLCYSL